MSPARYVFGPVPSRRLGRSLGVDPVPYKTCNWNCVYCQLGRTAPMTGERLDFVRPEAVVREVIEAVKRDGLDWITFVGSGEPTLHASLGWIIREVKAQTSKPVAVITNGSTLHRPDVSSELRAADAVLPTLDAGSGKLYRKINRPQPGFTFESLVNGLIGFREGYDGKLWIEVMLIKGLNDTPWALRDLADVLQRIGPDEVHLNLPTRPPAAEWVEPPDDETLKEAAAILGAAARVVSPASSSLELLEPDLAEAILGVITRHPMSEQQLLSSLAQVTPEQIAAALRSLESTGRAQAVERRGERFWCCAEGRY